MTGTTSTASPPQSALALDRRDDRPQEPPRYQETWAEFTSDAAAFGGLNLPDPAALLSDLADLAVALFLKRTAP